MVIFLYIVGHNTWMRPVADRFQHSTETVDCKFRRVLRVVHTYGQHLIKPDSNVVGLLEHLWGNNKYDPWFEVNDFIILVLPKWLFTHYYIVFQLIGTIHCREA